MLVHWFVGLTVALLLLAIAGHISVANQPGRDRPTAMKSRLWTDVQVLLSGTGFCGKNQLRDRFLHEERLAFGWHQLFNSALQLNIA
ncbi:hypothetical protein BH18VER1_BH18VER1_19780 [soil metagenome]